jgi:aryl-alcohol dehydrogenase-like predicted oxidoreductase
VPPPAKRRKLESTHGGGGATTATAASASTPTNLSSRSRSLAATHSVALGTLALSILYPDPAARPPREAAIALLRRAVLEHGVRLIDTADTYCGAARDLHYAERLVAECLAGLPPAVRGAVLVATKGGMARTGDGTSSSSWRPRNLTPASLRQAVAASREALHYVDSKRFEVPRPVGLWMMHHCDGHQGDSAEVRSLAATLCTITPWWPGHSL